MKLAVLGTGMVGKTIASKLVEIGHDVTMGSRVATSEGAVAWHKAQRESTRAHVATFEDAAKTAELLFNCTNGVNSLAALDAAGAENLANKILIDVANPLDFSNGMPPTLSITNTDSLGESIQRAFPTTKVVKALNTMNCDVMVNPARLPEDHDVFLCGDDADAKEFVRQALIDWFGWKHPIDLGGIASARGVEQFLPLWLRLWGALGTGDFNIKIVKA